MIGIGAGFATVEGGFLSANLLKFTEGGWVPVLLAVVLFTLMRIWQAGIAAVQKLADEMQIPIGDIVAQIDRGEIRRVPGTGVFVARITRDIPPIVVWYLRHIRSLHELDCDFSTCSPRSSPTWQPRTDWRYARSPRGCGGPMRVSVSWNSRIYQPCCSKLRQTASRWIPPTQLTFIGHVTIVPREDGKGLPRLVLATIAFLRRNSVEAIEYFRLPRDMVVEIGRQFAI